MYKKNGTSLDSLVPKAQRLAENGGNPREIIDISYYLKPYLKFYPELRSLVQRLIMKAHEKSKEKDANRNPAVHCDFAVHRLIWVQAIEFFVKDAKVWFPGIAIYHWKKMIEKKACEKHETQIENCFLEMKLLGVPKVSQMPQIPMAIA